MKLADIQQEALALTDIERASLVATLLDTLPPAGNTEISDEEVSQREHELESGQVTGILHDEFVRRVRNERGR